MRDSLLISFKLLLMIAIPLAAFATGLRATDPLWLLRRPRLLARSLIAVLVVVPVVAVLLLELLQPGQVVRAGIVISILSVGVGPPAALKRTGAADARIAYEVGLDVALLALAILYVPAAVALYGAIFHNSVRLDPSQVAKVVLLKMLLPLMLGVAFARFEQRLAGTVGRYASRFVDVAVLVVIVFALAVSWRSLVGLGLGAWLTIAVVAATAIAIGHLFGGSERQTRATLASFSALRFPALAFLMVAAVPGGKVLIPVVLAYVLTSALLVTVYGGVSTSRARRARSAPPPLQPAAPASGDRR